MDRLNGQTPPMLSFLLVDTRLVNWCGAHDDRFEWVNEVTVESRSLTFYSCPSTHLCSFP